MTGQYPPGFAVWLLSNALFAGLAIVMALPMLLFFLRALGPREPDDDGKAADVSAKHQHFGVGYGGRN
jgi:hypothetical protein